MFSPIKSILSLVALDLGEQSEAVLEAFDFGTFPGE